MSILVKDKEFYKKVLMLGAPISAQQIITVGVNMMDTIMLGQLDETALAASSMAVQVHNLFHFMCMGMSMGAAVLIARFWGAGEEKSLRKTLALMYRFCLALAGIFTLVVGLFPGRVLSLLTPEPDVIEEGIRYLRWALPCFFLYGLSTCTTHVLRNLRKMQVPLYTAIGAFFINVGANWVFIFGKFGAPAMGVAGAALGTLISRVFEFSVICGYFFFGEKRLRFRPAEVFRTPCGDLLPEYVRISVPVLISDTLLGVGNTATVSIVGHVNKTFMSAYTITTVTQQVSTVFSTGLGQAALIVTGNTLGEGDREKAQRQSYTLVLLALVIGALAGAFIVAIAPAVVDYYKIATETYDVAMELMDAVGIIVVFMMTGSILTKGILRGGGDTRFLMAADIVFLWAVSVPLGYLGSQVWGWRPFWILFALRIDHLLKSLLCLWRMRTGKWMKKISAVK